MSSCAQREPRSFRSLRLIAVVAAWLPAMACAATGDVAERPVAVRITWGGGQPQAWTGRIAVIQDGDATAVAQPVQWRTLSTEPDAAAFVHEAANSIEVHQPRPVVSDGIEIVVPGPRGRRLVAALRPAASSGPPVSVDVPLENLLATPASEPLDDAGNRLAVKLAAGDMLRVTFADPVAGDAGPAAGAIRRPGDRVRVTVDPLLVVKPDSGMPVVLAMRLTSVTNATEIAAQETVLTALPSDPAPAAAAGPIPMRFAPVSFDVVLPAVEGAYDIGLEAVERSSLRWTRPLATRTVQIVAVADAPPAASASAEWKVLYELDPGSPKLHERLRRLPGIGLPSMPLPAVPLPPMSLPSMSLPSVSLPTIPRPNMPLPKLPSVPVPSVPSLSSMVPRLSGLLATGHSRVEPHPLGPMLRLPPRDDTAAPTWEGVLIANAEPGLPHVVEIEFPSDQDASVAATILELDGAGARVQTRHAGGFDVRRDPGAARLGVHRFAFWPTTRQPLLVIANPGTQPALFGRVRVLAGPARLPIAGEPPGDGVSRRRLHAYVADPALIEFGGRERSIRDGAGAVADWQTHFDAMRHLTEQLRARAAAGAMVTVYAGGAATWPSAATRQAPRWGSGAGADVGLDPLPKNTLDLLCRLCGREGMRLLPALVFDAPLPALEATLARGGAEAVGIACVGRDGRPRRAAGHAGSHYNILDPRVQSAILDVVGELVSQTGAVAAVDGVAVVLTSDGWLHMPGVAWGLDDATFGRFLADTKLEEPAVEGNRFATRAALVEGPMRPQWLEWRAAQTSAFWSRLAGVVVQGRAGRSLVVAPTTLLSSGELAARFRPTLAAAPRTGDILREIAFDPARFAADPRILYVAPQVMGGGSLAAEASVAASNRTLAFIPTARRGAVLVGEPQGVDLADVVPHGPFNAASLEGVSLVHAAPALTRLDRSLAEAHVASDATVVFDAALVRTLPAQPSPSRQAVESLPAEPLDLVAGLPAPLVVRSRQVAGRTWLHVVNAAAAPATVTVTLDREPLGVIDAVAGTRLPLTGAAISLPVDAWGMRGLWVEGTVQVVAARIAYDAAVREGVVGRVTTLKQRREVLEMPVPLDRLDNPSFELGAELAAAVSARPSVPGWEIVEARRGTIGLVAGREATGDKAASFTSANGLSTLRSNPFARPASGRLSIAAWLRIKEGDPQPPLRIALEGDENGREYYRFAAIGGLAGGRPLTSQWSQFVLQVDDLPEGGLESLRVRFDLLGPGSVEIDDVRLFDLAFDESQRVELTRLITGLDQRLAADDVGGCLVALDGHWPRYLEAFVSEPIAPAPEQPKAKTSRVKSKNWWK